VYQWERKEKMKRRSKTKDELEGFLSECRGSSDAVHEEQCNRGSR